MRVFTQGWNSANKASASDTAPHRILWPVGGFWVDFKDGVHSASMGDISAKCVHCNETVTVTHG